MSTISFLSKENILGHREYLKQLKLLYSVLEKSYPPIMGQDIRKISKQTIAPSIKRQAIERKSEILLHELFFESFTENRKRCPEISSLYGSEANFLYEIERMSNDFRDGGFVVIYITGRHEVAFYCGKRASNLFIRATPVLAIDLHEHAYFMDYGFDRKRYVRCALAHLDLSKISEFTKND